MINVPSVDHVNGTESSFKIISVGTKNFLPLKYGDFERVFTAPFPVYLFEPIVNSYLPVLHERVAMFFFTDTFAPSIDASSKISVYKPSG